MHSHSSSYFVAGSRLRRLKTLLVASTDKTIFVSSEHEQDFKHPLTPCEHFLRRFLPIRRRKVVRAEETVIAIKRFSYALSATYEHVGELVRSRFLLLRPVNGALTILKHR